MYVVAGMWRVDNVKTSSFHPAWERTREPKLAPALVGLTLGALVLLRPPEQVGSFPLCTKEETEAQGASQGHTVRRRSHKICAKGS